VLDRVMQEVIVVARADAILPSRIYLSSGAAKTRRNVNRQVKKKSIPQERRSAHLIFDTTDY
jgi:hypothetical protein